MIEEYTKLLIDGDIIPYRAGFSAQRKVYTVKYKGRVKGRFEYHNQVKTWMKDNPNMSEDVEVIVDDIIPPLSNALRSAKSFLKKIIQVTECSNYEIFLSREKNYRYDLVEYYKANRDPNAKPFHFDNIIYYLEKEWGVTYVDKIEADDALGIAQAKHCTKDSCDTVIVSNDKDLDMIPGWHFNPTNEDLGVYWMDEWECMKWFYTQLLTGDASDNIKGVYGIGPVKADKILADCTSFYNMYERVLHEYGQVYPNIPCRMLEESARLLWILREPLEYDGAGKITNLWTPPGIDE